MNNLRPETEKAPFTSLDFVEIKTEINVLIVDDSESDRAIYSRYLQSESENIYCIIEAATLKEGLELWRSQQPNIVLMDLNLPDGSGLEFLEAINLDRAEDRVPVIMLTGQGNEKMAVSAMKLGAFDCLVKGDITAKSLTTTIKQALRETRLSRQLLRSQQQQILISEIALRICEFTDLDDISNAIVREVRQFIRADHATIYKFNPAELTERKRAKQKLIQLNQSLETKVKERTQELWHVNQLQREILDGADYEIISTDLNGIIQSFRETMIHLTQKVDCR
jgi:DNA-binding response OmpR family regulator